MSVHESQSSTLLEHPVSPSHVLSSTAQPTMPYLTAPENSSTPNPAETTSMDNLAESEINAADNSNETSVSPPQVNGQNEEENMADTSINASPVARDEASINNTPVEQTGPPTQQAPALSEEDPPNTALPAPGVPRSTSAAISTEDGTANSQVTESGAGLVTDIPSDPSSPPETVVPEVVAPAETDADSDSEPEDNIPSWVKWEEDTTVPDEEEMKEIEESEYDKLAATDVNAMEAQFYSDLEDPEQRPAKKLRLSWTIKGVRGTKDKPNMARVMNSPAVCVDGLYWSIKFYPRGDNCAALSAFVRCSRTPPKQTEEMPEHQFVFWEAAPDVDFAAGIEPKVTLIAPNTQRMRETCKSKKKIPPQEDTTKKTESDEGYDEFSREPVSREPESSDRREDEDDEITDSVEDHEDKDLRDWRVSAQLGMAIYNPAEPRTGHLQSDGHQFSKHCDDWGWVNFVGPWDEIHKRKKGQRQPLLRDDCLSIDAYVRIFDDPTQALWWHDSKTESQWPSKQLAGYYPMGTPALYHSPAVAGITAWCLLAPFRQIIQEVDGGGWRKDSKSKPMPLICQSQLVLHMMRHSSNDNYVNVFRVVEELLEADEPWEDVNSFWEVYRRGLELELASDDVSLKRLSAMFDADGKPFKMPTVPVPGEETTALGLDRYFEIQSTVAALPDFLPVLLNRQQFDKKKREWKLHHDRVRLSDEIDLSKWSTDQDAKFTLFGFVAHVGGRNSGKFYSVLRPNGIDTKWLAFEDGNGNKIFSYTKKRIELFEGLQGTELKEFSGSRENAYMAMYIRNSKWSEYLPSGGLELYKIPKWIRSQSDAHEELTEAERTEEDREEAELERQQEEQGMTVDLYLDEFIEGSENVLDLHDIRTLPAAQEYCQTLRIATDKTYRDLRKKIVEAFELDDTNKIGLWELNYCSLGKFSRADLDIVADRRKIERDVRTGERFRMWLSVLGPSDKHKSYKNLLPKIAQMGLEIKTPVSEPEKDKNDDEGSIPAPDSVLPQVELGQASDNSANDDHMADSSSSHTDDSNTTGVATPATGATGESTIDIEQDSIREAVATDVANATNHTEDSTVGSHSTDNTVQADATESLIPEPTASNEIPQHTIESSAIETATEPSADGMIAIIEPTTEAAVANSLSLASDEISAEDAAAIAAVLAADADEQLTTIQIEEPSTADEVARPDEITPIDLDIHLHHRPSSPKLTLHLYGFLHTFEAQKQVFQAQKPINPEAEQEIGNFVRKALGYDEEKEIRIWRREGPSGTVPVTLNSTFSGSNFQDGYTLIVGEALSEAEIEGLKQEGKFWMPAQLIKYNRTAKRGHPVLSKTSKEPVEITGFGGDYFKGPLVNGQPHGDNCLLITSTGHTYEGPMIAGLKSGEKGKMTFENGDVYIGGWLNDERHGHGEHSEARTGNRYVGGFQNGKRWGEGVTYWKVADDQAAMCQICYGEEIDALFYDCGHVCACVECAKQCESCPICRKAIRHVVKMFRA